MDKGYYKMLTTTEVKDFIVAIHNKNGQGLLREYLETIRSQEYLMSQSTIKMDKGYYQRRSF